MELVTFNYQQLDTETRIVAQQRAGEIRSLVRNTAENIMQIGEKLLDVQVKLGGGHFEDWLQHEFDWSRRTAYRFISVHKEFYGRANLAQLDIATSALYLLAAPSTPEEARVEVIERAEAGEPITHAAAKQIVAVHKPPQPAAPPETESLPAWLTEDEPDPPRPTPAPQPVQDSVTRYCPRCGQRRDFEPSRAMSDLNSRCQTCNQSAPANKWPIDPPQAETLSYGYCQSCGTVAPKNQFNYKGLCAACRPAAPAAFTVITNGDPADSPAEFLEESPYNYKRDAKANREGSLYEPKGYDACQTPPHAIDPLLPYLPASMLIWEPAQGEGNLTEAFYDAGRNCIGSDILTGGNFFNWQPADGWDAIVTNPPYSIKYDWLKRCYELGKPFALLLPVETLGAATAQEMFSEYGLEVMLLNKRINFKMPNKGWDGAGAQFPVAWFTWGLNLGSAIVYGKLDPTGQ